MWMYKASGGKAVNTTSLMTFFAFGINWMRVSFLGRFMRVFYSKRKRDTDVKKPSRNLVFDRMRFLLKSTIAMQ